MQTQVADTISSRLANPGSVFDPAKSAALENNNRNFDNLTARLKASASGRGFGRAGTTIGNEASLDVARAGSAGNINTQFAGMQTDYESKLLEQAQKFGFTNPGSTQTTTTNPGYGGLISGGLSMATSLFGLNALLKGAGGGAGGGGGGGGMVDYGGGAGSWG